MWRIEKKVKFLIFLIFALVSSSGIMADDGDDSVWVRNTDGVMVPIDPETHEIKLDRFQNFPQILSAAPLLIDEPSIL